MQSKGYVSYCSSKPFGNKMLWSFRLKNEEKWFGCGETDPKVKTGEQIEFSYTEKNGRYNVEIPTIVRFTADTTVHNGTPSKNLTGNTNSGGREEYWNDKAAKDVEKDLRIQWQSARNAAIEVVGILVSSDSLKLPEKNKSDAILGKIADLTDKFYAESGAVGAEVDGAGAGDSETSSEAA